MKNHVILRSTWRHTASPRSYSTSFWTQGCFSEERLRNHSGYFWNRRCQVWCSPAVWEASRIYHTSYSSPSWLEVWTSQEWVCYQPSLSLNGCSLLRERVLQRSSACLKIQRSNRFWCTRCSGLDSGTSGCQEGRRCRWFYQAFCWLAWVLGKVGNSRPWFC